MNEGDTEMTVDKDLIILADDDKYSVDFFKTAIKNMYHEIHLVTCDKSEELIKYLSDRNNVRPAVVFLGINMPITPGLATLEEIRKISGPDELTVVVYSSHANRALKVTTERMGADYCILKPTSSIILQNLIEQILSTISA